MPQELHNFLKDMLLEAGQVELTPEVEQAMIEDLGVRLETHLLMAAVSNLTEEQNVALENMVEAQNTSEEIQAFLESSIPNYNDVFAEALLGFRALYVEGTKGEESVSA